MRSYSSTSGYALPYERPTFVYLNYIAFLLVVSLVALFIISVKLVMPTVGQELMPPMDTGAIAIKITTDAELELHPCR
jgi:multidrug efflux pump subunit AcrB